MKLNIGDRITITGPDRSKLKGDTGTLTRIHPDRLFRGFNRLTYRSDHTRKLLVTTSRHVKLSDPSTAVQEIEDESDDGSAETPKPKTRSLTGRASVRFGNTTYYEMPTPEIQTIESLAVSLSSVIRQHVARSDRAEIIWSLAYACGLDDDTMIEHNRNYPNVILPPPNDGDD